MDHNIHFIHFGDKPLSDKLKQRIDSFKRYNPSYNIRVWTEGDFEPFVRNKFLIDALTLKNYAYMSDYYRLYVLYNYGGLYCDTDTECFKSLDDLMDKDELLEYEFNGADDKPFIGTAVMGFEKGHSFVADLLKKYEQMRILEPGKAAKDCTNQFIITDFYNDSDYNFDILPLESYLLYNHALNPNGYIEHYADKTWGIDYSYIIMYSGEINKECLESVKKNKGEIILCDDSLFLAIEKSKASKGCFILHDKNIYKPDVASFSWMFKHGVNSIGEFDLTCNDAFIKRRIYEDNIQNIWETEDRQEILLGKNFLIQ